MYKLRNLIIDVNPINPKVQSADMLNIKIIKYSIESLRENDGKLARSGTEIIDILCNVKGIDVNPRDSQGRTPLMIACMTGNEAAVRSLVAQPEIDLDCRDDKGGHWQNPDPFH